MSTLISPEDFMGGASAPAASSGGLMSPTQFSGLPVAEQPSTAGGIVRNFAAGFNQGLTGMAGAPVDIATSAINRGRQFAAHMNAEFAKDFPAAVAKAPPMPVPGPIENPVLGQHDLDMALGAAGIGNPEDVQPHGAAERIARSAGIGSSGTLIPYGGARTLIDLGMKGGRLIGGIVDALGGGTMPGMTAAGAGAGAGSQAAGEAVPKSWDDSWAGRAAKLGVETLGGLGGGGLGALGEAGVRALGSAGSRVVADATAPFRTAGQEQLAVNKVRGAATEPGALAGKLDVPPEESQLVPGSQPTVTQLTGDMGVGSLERQRATVNPTPYIERAGQQNQARLNAIENTAPEGSNSQSVGQYFRQALNDADRQREAAITSASNTAAAARENIPNPALQSTQEFGQGMRSDLGTANTAAKGRESALWQAIDPDGTAHLDVTPIKGGIARAVSQVPASAKQPAGEELDILKTVHGWPQVQSFGELQALRSRITTAIRQERMTAGGESPVVRRLNQYLDAVDSGLEGALNREAAINPSMADALQAEIKQWYADRRAREAVGLAGAPAEGTSGTGPSGDIGVAGAAGEAAGRPGNPAGGAGLPARSSPQLESEQASKITVADERQPYRPIPDEMSPEARVAHDIENGARYGRRTAFIADADGKIRQRTVATWANHYKGFNDLWRDSKGTVLAGDGTRQSPLHAVSAEEIAARRTAAIDDLTARTAEGQRQDERLHNQDMAARAKFDADAESLARRIAGLGVNVHIVIPDDTSSRYLYVTLPSGEGIKIRIADHPQPQAYRRTAEGTVKWGNVGGYSPTLGYRHEASDFSIDPKTGNTADDAMALVRSKLPMDLNAARSEEIGARNNSDLLERYRLARDATVNRKRLFRSGPVGDILAPGPNGTPFRLGDSQVAARVWRSPESIDAYIKAVGDRPRAQALLEDYAAFDLRRSAGNPDGTLDPVKVDRWLAKNRERLNLFPDLRQRFADAASAERTLQNAIDNRALAQKQAERSITAKFIGRDPVDAVNDAFRGDAEQNLRELAAATASSPTARAGLQRAIADWLVRRFEGFTPSADTDRNILRAAEFQKFLRNNRAALGQVFQSPQLDAMDAVAADLRRAARATQATKSPVAGSNTAQDTGARQSILEGAMHHRAEEVAGAVIGGHVAGPAGSLAGWFGPAVFNSLKNAGINNVNDIVDRMLLDPEFARAMLVKYQPRDANGFRSAIGRLDKELRAMSVVTPTIPAAQPKRRFEATE